MSADQIAKEKDKFSKETYDKLTRYDLVNFALASYKKPTKKFAILNANSDSVWQNLYEGCYQGFFQGENEQWENYYLPQNKWPNIENALEFDGMIITGSHYRS